MDSEFIKQRAAHCRFLAEKADPFIKRRLLDLAVRYDARLDIQSRRTFGIPGSLRKRYFLPDGMLAPTDLLFISVRRG